jgi:hypothetical protein
LPPSSPDLTLDEALAVLVAIAECEPATDRDKLVVSETEDVERVKRNLCNRTAQRDVKEGIGKASGLQTFHSLLQCHRRRLGDLAVFEERGWVPITGPKASGGGP